MKNPPMQTSCLSSLEGVLLKNPDTFSYFMLVAFEASGLIRFTLLLLLWPFISILRALDMNDLALKLMIFVSTAGVRVKEIESVARAVLPKFYYDDIDFDHAWKVFSSYEKRVVVTKMPTMMVERFVKEHLMADEVIGTELKVNTRFGFVTGFVKSDIGSVRDRVVKLFGEEMKPTLGMIRRRECTTKVHDSDDEFISLCEDQCYPPFLTSQTTHHHHLTRPVPVIFHDGRLVKRPTPFTSLLILLWLPIGILLATIRIIIGIITPIQALPYINAVFGGGIHVKGKPPPPPPTTSKTTSPPGVLFVCTHRTLMDPVILSYALNRRIPAVTYSISRLTEILSPIPTVRLTRVRSVDADRIKSELAKGDLVVCPEGTTCREPFLLRFSALFAELTDRIVPVAMNYRVGFFHATTARGWKGLDPVFFFMNPRPVYEVTFLNQLPVEATCSAGKSPQDVANYVQRLLAATLGFECTNFTRKDKYRLLAGNDGTVVRRGGGGGSKWWSEGAKKVVRVFKPCIQ